VPRWLDNAARRGAPLAPRARSLYPGLKVGRKTLVHGDFHHHNLLADGARYLAIDPKPMLGEPEFDVYSYLVNPLGSQMRRDLTEARLAAFAAAGLDDGRMRAWAVIRGAYLSSNPQHLEVLRALL
jgi:streptomycin 6-kinase